MTCHDVYDQPAGGPLTVVGVDFSPASAAALRWGAAKAAKEGGRVRVVHVFRPIPPLPPAHSAYVPERPAPSVFQRNEIESQLREFVEETLGQAPAAAHVRVQAVDGMPHQALIEASREADVLVVGASHRTAFATRVLGSTTSACAAAAHCPVMVVPESWRPAATPTPAAVS